MARTRFTGPVVSNAGFMVGVPRNNPGYAGAGATILPALYDLGTPIVATANRIVVSTNMINGAYTIANQPDVPRNITLTRTQGGAALDTPGIVTITGTDSDNNVISEVIIPGASATLVNGVLAFRTVISVVGSGWSTGETPDTLVVGIGNLLGVPVAITAAANVMLGIVATSIVAVNAVVAAPVTLAGSTVNLSAGTYNGTNRVHIWVRQPAL